MQTIIHNPAVLYTDKLSSYVTIQWLNFYFGASRISHARTVKYTTKIFN